MDRQVVIQLETAFEQGQYGRVIYSADELLQARPPRSLRAHILYWKGSALVTSGPAWQGQAIACYRDGIDCAGRDRPIKTRLMAALAYIYSMSGDWVACAKLVNDYEAAGEPDSLEIKRWAAFLYFAHGYALDHALRLQEALAAYRRALELWREVNLTARLGAALHNVGGVHLAMGNLPEALEVMQETEAIMSPRDFGHKLLSRRAEYALASNDLVGAQQFITEALLHPALDDYTRADVYHTWARTLLALDRPKEARDKALTALDYAMKERNMAAIYQLNQFLRQFSPKLY